MPFADGYVVNAHPPLPLYSKVPRPWALDTYSTVRSRSKCGFDFFATCKDFASTCHSSLKIKE